MAKWTLEIVERKEHEDGAELVTHEAKIHLDAANADNPVTLGDVAQLVTQLNAVDGIPWTARLGVTLDVPLRWTPADLAPEPAPEPTP